MDNQIRTRRFKESNYKGIYVDGKTMRVAIDRKKPILELKYPEFFDVKINNYCRGNCPYCYQSSTKNGKNFDGILIKTLEFFGKLSENEKPFQVAIGGGNPNEHPDFISLLALFYELGITPNYTTNGMGMTDEILDATKKYCGGVAISTHRHLMDHWIPAIRSCHTMGIKTNLHHIISDRLSIDRMIDVARHFPNQFDHIVLLPYTSQGRAEYKEIDYDYLEERLDRFTNNTMEKIAFGAGFYDFLKTKGRKYGISLYEPEIFSKYLDMDDMSIYPSSFSI